uniref:Uncharacterized protein n=1 Tax=Ditylenchus dipsaci TaxID=166011 RepID=A0A915EBL3_9BILA
MLYYSNKQAALTSQMSSYSTEANQQQQQHILPPPSTPSQLISQRKRRPLDPSVQQELGQNFGNGSAGGYINSSNSYQQHVAGSPNYQQHPHQQPAMQQHNPHHQQQYNQPAVANHNYGQQPQNQAALGTADQAMMQQPPFGQPAQHNPSCFMTAPQPQQLNTHPASAFTPMVPTANLTNHGFQKLSSASQSTFNHPSAATSKAKLCNHNYPTRSGLSIIHSPTTQAATQPDPPPTYLQPSRRRCSLNGPQLVQFLIKATIRLPQGPMREGIQLNLGQLNELVTLGHLSESCLKKLNFVVDAVDRGAYEEAWQFFEQLQITFPGEMSNGAKWTQGLKFLILELKKQKCGGGVYQNENQQQIRAGSAGSRMM